MKNFFKKSYGKVTIWVLCLTIIDLIIKFLVVKFQLNVTLIENVLRIVQVENMGSAWGMPGNNLLNVIVSNAIVLGIIIKFINLQQERMDTKTLISLSLILAGGVSNLFERLIRGRVTDYIQIFPGSNFPIFNLADFYIVVGWVMFAAILAYLTGSRKVGNLKRTELLAEIKKENKE